MIRPPICWTPLFLATLLSLAACGEKSSGDALTSARDMISNKDPAAAQIELKALLQENPNSGEARYLLGLLMRDMGENANAEAELRRALEAGHPAEQVLPVLAEVMHASGKDALLISQFAATQLTEPVADASLKVHLASAYLATGDQAAALTQLTQVEARRPDFMPAKLLRARVAAKGGDREGALRQLEQILAQSADNPQAWALKGDLLTPSGTDKDYGPSIAAWRKSLAVGGDKVLLHGVVTSALMAAGDFAGAQAQWALLQKLAPKHPQTLFLEAQLADQRGDFVRARELSQLLLRGAPGNLRVLMLGGRAEQKLGGWAQAETLFAKAVQVAPALSPPRLLLAEVQIQAGQADKALGTLKPLLAAAPPDAEALALAAQAQLRMGDLKAADALFAQAAKIKPDDMQVRTALALSKVAKGQDAAGIKALQEIASVDKGISADLALIVSSLRHKDRTGALQAIDALAAKLPKDPAPDEFRARVALDAKDNAGARRHLEAALAKDADFMPALSALAGLDLAENRAPAAQARFEALLQRNPRHIAAMHALAMINARQGGRPEDTGKWLEAAVKADPNDLPSRERLIDFYLAADRPKQALAAAQTAVVVFPASPELLERLGRSQLAAGEPHQAIVAFNKLVALQPKSALPHLHLAETYEVLKQDAAAAASLHRAVALEPGLLAVQKAAVRLALYERKPADALAAVRRIQTQYPGLATGFILEGNLALMQKQWDNAAAAFRKATTKADPGESAQRLYTSLIGGHKMDEALKFAADWRQQHPADTDFVMHLADTAMVGGRAAQAEPLYKAVLERAPNSVQALNNLAFVLSTQNKPGGSALADQALKLAPGTASVMDTLALSLAVENKLDLAVEVQTQVVGMSPEVPAFRLQLARLLLKSGDKDKARTELQTLAKLGTAFPRQAEVAEMLKAAGS